MPTVKWNLTIDEVDDEHVHCTGSFPTADGKSVHSMLRPRFLRPEIAWKAEPKVGDRIAAYDDGTHEHFPLAG
jgi:GTP-dependent phosphoenolpyruvate carboxykinase